MAQAKISRIASDFETQLSGAITAGDTSFTLQSVTDEDGNTLSDGIWCFTLDRDSAAAKEYLVGQLDSATKTVSSISSVSRQGVLTANAQNSHRIGANVIISDHSVIVALARVFNGLDTIDPSAPLSYASAPTLSSATQIATKGYVDSVVTGGTVNSDRIILGSQTAGETIAEGDIIYFKSSDSRWWLARADDSATFSNVQLGVAQGSGTAGNAITDGVLIYGKSENFTGLTATAIYYLSDTAGAVATSAGTNSVIIGQAFSTTGIFFNPNVTLSLAIATTTGVSDAGKVIKTNADGLLDKTFTTAPVVRTYLSSGSPHTWTKPTGLKYVIVEVQGVGGSGATNPSGDGAAGGGGGGGYSKKLIAASSLGSTETVTISTSSSFGSHCSATGGSNGSSTSGGAGGVGSGGDINLRGQDGSNHFSNYTSEATPGLGGSSHFGGGGKQGNSGGNYGGGGGGGVGTGGGGGGGGAGIAIVTEYYN